MPQNPSCCPRHVWHFNWIPKSRHALQAYWSQIPAECGPFNNFTTVPHFRLTVSRVNTLCGVSWARRQANERLPM